MKRDNLEANDTAKRTEFFLQSRGWCLWKCSCLDGEVLTLFGDGYQPGIEERKRIDDAREKAGAADPEVIYTYTELLIAGESDDIRKLYQVKKTTGGRLIGQEVKG